MGSLFAYDSPLWKMTDRIVRFLFLSILWAVCCIPIFTIGAATTALYSVSLKCVRNQESYLTSSFFRAFKQNFKQGTMIWGMFLCLGFCLGLGVIYYFRLQISGVFMLVAAAAFFSIFLAFLLAHLFVYPLLAAFNNTTGRTMANALVMALTHLPSGILMLFISLAVIIAGAFLFPPLLIVAPGMTAYINSGFFTKIFDRYSVGNAGCREASL